MQKTRITFLITCLAMLSASAQEVEMATGMRADGKIYVVVGVLGIIFLGLAVYLFMLDRKISKIEKQVSK